MLPAVVRRWQLSHESHGIKHSGARQVMDGKRRRLDGPGVGSLPDHLLVEVASFLRKESRALWAVSMGAPSCHWSAARAPTPAGRKVLTLLREDWRDEWAVFDFGDFLRPQSSNGFFHSNTIGGLSDDDLQAVLICIDGARSVKSLYLTGCTRLTGRGISPLRESTILERVDISLVMTRDYRPEDKRSCGLELDQVLPVLDTILANKGNRLRHIQLPKKWRNEKDGSLNRFMSRYNCALGLTTEKCCQCEEEARKSRLLSSRVPIFSLVLILRLPGPPSMQNHFCTKMATIATGSKVQHATSAWVHSVPMSRATVRTIGNRRLSTVPAAKRSSAINVTRFLCVRSVMRQFHVIIVLNASGAVWMTAVLAHSVQSAHAQSFDIRNAAIVPFATAASRLAFGMNASFFLTTD